MGCLSGWALPPSPSGSAPKGYIALWVLHPGFKSPLIHKSTVKLHRLWWPLSVISVLYETKPKGNFQFSYPFMPQEHFTLLTLLPSWKNHLSLAFLALCSLAFLPTRLIISFSVSVAVSSLHPLSVLHNLSLTPGFITTCSLSLSETLPTLMTSISFYILDLSVAFICVH